MKLTKNRKAVLSALAKHHGSLSASELHERLPDIHLVTIYRSLEALTEAGHIKKLHLSSNEASYEYQAHPHHHAVCTDCDRVIHFEAETEKIKAALKLSGFAIHDIDVTVRGTCNRSHPRHPISK